MPIHDGHRQRLKERFLKAGLESFAPVNVLELLLFYCIPRKDTNVIAHRLLDTFGSFQGVLNARAEDLQAVEDIGENTATFLCLLNAVNRYYQSSAVEDIKVIRSVEDYGTVLMPNFAGRRNEMVFLLCLDTKCKVICCRQIGEGSVNSAGVSIRKIVEVALGVGASVVVLAHNHPSGVAIPSGEDMQTTIRAAKALQTVDVTLLDHLIFADNDYISLRQSGRYRPEEIFL